MKSFDVREVDELVGAIKRHLAGKGPELQGAALCDLVAMYFAGHNPAVRDRALSVWIEHMRALIPVNEAMVVEFYGKPNPWDAD